MERIILGSADVYIQAFDGSTVPVTADICKPENLMAYISGGASVEYKPSFYTAKDDTGKKNKTIVTEEEVTLKTDEEGTLLMYEEEMTESEAAGL